MIDIQNLTVQIGQRVLLDNTSFYIGDNHKVGLIGHNGCGKTTFFKVLLGQTEYFDGDINLPQNACIASVEQTIEDTSMSVLDYVISKDIRLCSLRNRLLTASDIEKPEILEELKILDSDGAEGRIAQILTGLGFKNDDLSRPVSDFSGGWRMRLSLAGALFQYSDILLLDEPTNHLDLEASIWLENHLSAYKGTLILISHDRMILNRLCDHIASIENQKITLYKGNFDTYEQNRQLQRQQQVAQAEKIMAKRAHMQAFIDRFRYKASKAKQAQSRIKMLEKMAEIPIVNTDETDCFSFPKPEKLSPPLISLDNVSTGYGDKTVLRKLSLSIGINERIVLLGRNGNGKSTLAKLLCGKLPLFEGNIHRLSGLKIGYFAQHQEDDLPLDLTPLDMFTPLLPNQKPAQIRSYLAQYGINGDKALTLIKRLSGGEKARLIFAQIALEKPALLILDEPTNHLDMKGRDALLSALNDFEGSVVLITHDFHLIELLADDLWLIDKERCLPFSGDLNDYRSFLLNKEMPKDQPKNIKTEEQKPQAIQRQSQAEIRKIKAQLGQIEKELERLSAEKENLQKQFEKPLTGSEIVAVQNKLTKIEQDIEIIELKWLDLSEKIC